MTRKLLTERQVAELLEVSIRTLQAWRMQNDGPPYIKVGFAVRYDPADLEEWLQARKRVSVGGCV